MLRFRARYTRTSAIALSTRWLRQRLLSETEKVRATGGSGERECAS